ncbi:MAG: HAMP domain-containing histidine kinase [Prevotella sp.]|nr:HAMP domain-containing histidine kinase [Prevotella sp.]
MKRIVFTLLLSLSFGCGVAVAQDAQKSQLQQRAETEFQNHHPNTARYTYIRAYEDYFQKGQMKQGLECAAEAVELYIKDSSYQEAFDLLRTVDQAIVAQVKDGSKQAALRYLNTKERYQLYMRFKKPTSAKEQLNAMESFASNTSDEEIKNDLLYTKALYYYTIGQSAKGNAVFKEMADKLTASKEYGKVDEVYKTLIANGRKSGSANIVAESYHSYMDWKDSVNARKLADETGALKKQIAENEASIAEKDSSLTIRQAIIIGLGILAAALAAALVLGAIVLLRYIVQNRKLKKNLNLSNENNALKAKFISNISAQIEPTLQKLDSRQPEVKALLDFSEHIQTLSKLENASDEEIELEDTQIPQFCEGLMDQIRHKVKSNVKLTVEAPKMSAMINREYVSHILLHLLNNAVEYTPEEGHIRLEFKKRGAHKFQFLVSDTGQGIPEEKRDDVFKPFLEIKDLTTGDGLGLPICKQMALKMNGDLDIDPEFTKGTRFVLDLHA